uniref:OBP47-like domain-containing protein n=1 Tax=Anopheles atroparvus TaxID=41427 RepID=A0A182JGK1_ANOAO
MATSVSRSQLQLISITFGKVLLALWLVQLVHGEPDAACKKVPEYLKGESDEKCCEIPQFFLNETIKDCWSGLERSSKSDAEKSCEFSSCIFKKDNLVKSDGHMDVDRMRTFIKGVQASSEWKSLAEKVLVEECIPMIEKDATTIRKLMKSDCDSSPAFLIACGVAKLFAKCPSSDWTGSPMCDEWKTYFTKCGNTVDDLNEMFKQVESRKLAESGQQ